MGLLGRRQREKRSWRRGAVYSIDGAVFLLDAENKVSLMHSGV